MEWEPTLRAYTTALKQLQARTIPPHELKRIVATLDILGPAVYGPLPTQRQEARRTKLLLKAFDEIIFESTEPKVKAA